MYNYVLLMHVTLYDIIYTLCFVFYRMYCGVCGSDMHTADSGWHPLDYPQIVGHELIGKVVKVGKNVTHLKVGDIGGVGAQCWSCMGKYGVSECDACNDGNENCCPRSAGTYDGKYPDGQYTQGGYQYQYVTIIIIKIYIYVTQLKLATNKVNL